MVLVLLAGCEPDARSDAIIYLDRVQRLDLDDPISERRRLIDSLASLPLSAPEVRTARDSCVEAHQAILEAEELTRRARRAVERHEEESMIPAPERVRIERDISASNRLIERSRSMFDMCHRLTRGLELRFRSPRRRSTN